MKKSIALTLGLAITTASFAQERTSHVGTDTEPQIRLVTTSHQTVKLFIQPRQAKVQIVLKDRAGHLLYSSSSLDLRKGYSRQFDVSDLTAGTYQLTIGNETETVTRTFVVQPVASQTTLVLL